MFRSLYRKICLPSLILFLIIPSFSVAGDGRGGAVTAQTTINEEGARPAFIATPRELDLGDIGPGDVADGVFSLKNVGGGALQWFTNGPEGWGIVEGQRLMGSLASEVDYLRLSLRSIKNSPPDVADKTRPLLHNIQISVEAGDKSLYFRKELPVGIYRETLKLTYAGGTRTVYFGFRLTDMKLVPQLNVEPPLIDFGILVPGKQVTRQIKITNKGKETAKWRVVVPKSEGEKTGVSSYVGRYVSFFSDDARSGAGYAPPVHLRDLLEVSGKWQEQDGYPAAFGANNFIRYRFSGTGAGIYLRRGPEEGPLAVYLDDQLIGVYDGNNPERGREEFTAADGLPDGTHVLTLVNGDGRAIIEGVRVYGKELMKGPPGWLTVVPDSGTTTRETDYANIRMDTQYLNPGFYGEQLVITSDKGDVMLPISVEIRSDQLLRVLDVYRYVRNYNYLYTTNPQAEAGRLQAGSYKKEGIAFRLFAPGTPGTTEFYRWYNTAKDDHYYSYDLNGSGNSLKGYVLEGSIGNIGTSKLTNSRELYLWFNPVTGRHFYTIDQKGENMNKIGYKFDGIAGYVR